MHHKNRPGYTLMEMVCVIALIVIIMAIATPVVQSMLDDANLMAATDMVRAKAAETRAQAMESGKPWRLAFIPNTGWFQLAPDDSSDWDSMDQNSAEKEGLFRDQLPRDIHFGVTPSDIQGGSGGSPGTAWQTVVVYTYDGSAREDSMIYYGKVSTPPMGMEVRALTGSVTMKTYTEVMAMQP